MGIIKLEKNILILVVYITITNLTWCQDLEVFVSPLGNDSDTGTRQDPLRTLEAARDMVRKSDHRTNAVIWLWEGVYQLENTFELTSEDSGIPDYPVIYRVLPGEEAKIVGGIELTNWEPVKNEAVLTRLAPQARGQVMQVDLRVLGITDYGQVKNDGIELFFNDQPMMLSRWPNEGFVKITDLVEPNTVNVRGVMGSKTGKFMYNSDRPNRWFGESEIWVHGYWFWDWSDEHQKIESIDTERRIVAITPPYHSYGYRIGQWFYWENILAELDMSGEWYLDRETGILYFWPPGPIEQGRAVVSILDTLVTMTNVSHVMIRGIIFEAARGTAMVIKDCKHTQVAGCILHNVGDKAIFIDGGLVNGVIGCDIYETGRGSIDLNGGDRPSLTPGGHFASNNHIHHFGRWDRMYTPAIVLDGVGNRASHNLIHNAPHMAIEFKGNDHSIEFNEIHNVCLESNDAGAIYAGRDWTMRGTTIRYNYLHDITGYEGLGCVGVYLDDMFCGTEIYGNIFFRVTRAAFVGGGRDNTIENNIFIECQPAVHVDNRGLDWASGSVEGTMTTRLNAMPYKSELWQLRYPELMNILEDEPGAPRGNVIARNISWGGHWDEISNETQPYVTMIDNWVNMDPQFVGVTPETFDLPADSSIYEIGFKRIPFSEIGLYIDTYRKELPE